MSENFQAFLVTPANLDEGNRVVSASWQSLSLDQLDEGEVLIEVEYSALNYKDSLSASGHPGVARKLPLIPGIDAVGVVVESQVSEYSVGDAVFVAHANFGTSHHGGFSQRVRVPAEFVYRRPDSLSARSTATWGTAGFTAAQSVLALTRYGVAPEMGPVLVTGATGGVGIFAVMILAELGFEVIASTGKLDRVDDLKRLGATAVIDRNDVVDDSSSPLLKATYAAAIDSVGGTTLASVLRKIKIGGAVTACGLVAGDQLHTSVYPFILRGVSLFGIDSANIDRATRAAIWESIAMQWHRDAFDDIATIIEPEQLVDSIAKIRAGQIFGRVLVDVNA